MGVEREVERGPYITIVTFSNIKLCSNNISEYIIKVGFLLITCRRTLPRDSPLFPASPNAAAKPA
jgi:hypothetical protein